MPEQPGFESAVLARIAGQIDPLVDAVAGQMGLPPGGKRYSEKEQLYLWSYSPIASPQVRVETMLSLKQLGKSNEEITDMIYPKRRGLIMTGRPRVQDQIRYSADMDKLMSKKATEAGYEPAPPEPTMPAETAPVSLPEVSSPRVAPVEMPLMPEPAPASSGTPSMLDMPAFGPMGE